jgi:hypothetical protein
MKTPTNNIHGEIHVVLDRSDIVDELPAVASRERQTSRLLAKSRHGLDPDGSTPTTRSSGDSDGRPSTV